MRLERPLTENRGDSSCFGGVFPDEDVPQMKESGVAELVGI